VAPDLAHEAVDRRDYQAAAALVGCRTLPS
jgi:hypothetical protein